MNQNKKKNNLSTVIVRIIPINMGFTTSIKQLPPCALTTTTICQHLIKDDKSYFQFQFKCISKNTSSTVRSMKNKMDSACKCTMEETEFTNQTRLQNQYGTTISKWQQWKWTAFNNIMQAEYLLLLFFSKECHFSICLLLVTVPFFFQKWSKSVISIQCTKWHCNHPTQVSLSSNIQSDSIWKSRCAHKALQSSNTTKTNPIRYSQQTLMIITRMQ